LARTALVTGGNRGIGLEVCRQLGDRGLRVILSSRDSKLGERATEALRSDGLDVHFEQLDVSKEPSIAACARRLEHSGDRIDLLVNNAAIYPPGDLMTLTTDVLKETLAVNFFGPLWMCQTFVPAMRNAGFGRVVNVSSGYGSFAEGIHGPAAYGLSKAALNALTVKLALEVKDNVKINAACPGWVRTRMGGESAPRSVEEAADTIVWLATLPSNGPTGGFFRDRKRIPW
jgi:NAD(P)-dependent dehydrogenase (short-subunit alcohol dehydrogenase family)